MLKGLDYKGITCVRAINAESYLSVKLTRKSKIYVCCISFHFTHIQFENFPLIIGKSFVCKLKLCLFNFEVWTWLEEILASKFD